MMNNDMNANVIAARTALTPIVWGTTYAVTTTWLPAGHPVTAGLLRALPAYPTSDHPNPSHRLVVVAVSGTRNTQYRIVFHAAIYGRPTTPRRCRRHPHKHLPTCRNDHISFSIRN